MLLILIFPLLSEDHEYDHDQEQEKTRPSSSL